jgi:hypothetical protein
MSKLYKVVVPSDIGHSSIPLSLEEALEYAFDCNCPHIIIDLDTGRMIDEMAAWEEFGSVN